MNNTTIKLKSKVDMRQLKKARKELDRLSVALERANSLMDELAHKEVEITITSDVQQFDHIEGKRFPRFLRRIYDHTTGIQSE